jgi:hypothetical protein
LSIFKGGQSLPFFILFPLLFQRRFGGDSWSTGDPAGVGADCPRIISTGDPAKPASVASSQGGTIPCRRIPHAACIVISVHHTTQMNTLNVASNIKTRQIVWVRNGAKILSGPSHVWATMGRKGTL